MKPEAAIEKYLKERVEAVGGVAYKFVSPARRNVPDRICVFPSGLLVFVECKAPGEEAREAQMREIQRLEALKQKVVVVSTKADVNELLVFCK